MSRSPLIARRSLAESSAILGKEGIGALFSEYHPYMPVIATHIKALDSDTHCAQGESVRCEASVTVSSLTLPPSTQHRETQEFLRPVKGVCPLFISLLKRHYRIRNARWLRTMLKN